MGFDPILTTKHSAYNLRTIRCLHSCPFRGSRKCGLAALTRLRPALLSRSRPELTPHEVARARPKSIAHREKLTRLLP